MVEGSHNIHAKYFNLGEYVLTSPFTFYFN